MKRVRRERQGGGRPASRAAARAGRGRRAKRRTDTTAANGAVGTASPQLLYVLSDSTGNLPRHMVAAFLTQFPGDTFAIRAKCFLDSAGKLDAALGEIRQRPGIVLHALVDPAMKWRVAECCLHLKLHACDLTGPFVQFLAHASGVEPKADVRRLHDVDDAYRRRVKAVEFALEHDDGLGLDTLHHADVVLVGVSRTSKTPTCMYLAQQGYNAANVSLAPGVAPPAQLLTLPGSKVAALIIDPRQLAEIRTRRQVSWHMADTSYNTAAHVEAEVAQARLLFARRRWAVFDVTDQAIEETAARIVDRLGLAAAQVQAPRAAAAPEL